jgi:hypothetical protein
LTREFIKKLTRSIRRVVIDDKHRGIGQLGQAISDE